MDYETTDIGSVCFVTSEAGDFLFLKGNLIMTFSESEVLNSLKRLDKYLSAICVSKGLRVSKLNRYCLEYLLNEIANKISWLELNKSYLNQLELCNILIAKKIYSELKHFCVLNEFITI